MNSGGTIKMPPNQQNVLERFTSACRKDARVAAAILGGSRARGTADLYSDLDLYLITTDADYDNFLATRKNFARQLGELVYSEDFGISTHLFCVFLEGTECDLEVYRESNFTHIFETRYAVLLDKTGMLEGADLTGPEIDRSSQEALLVRQVNGFWHDCSHFITAMARGQLWWAMGQLEVLRGICVSLARLEHNLMDGEAEGEMYFKVEKYLPEEMLEPLRTTYCPMQPDQMLRAGLEVVKFYQELAARLAKKHGLAYPAALETIYMDRLDSLRAGMI